MSSSLGLMLLYTVVSLAMQGLAIGVIILIEPMLGGWSGVAFMTSYLLTFWIAWVVCVRLTEPKAETAAAGQASRA